MFRWLNRKIKYLAHQNNQKLISDNHGNKNNNYSQINSNIEKNIQFIKEQFGENVGMVYRTLKIGKENPRKAVLITIDGMVEKKHINDNILKPLMEIDLNKQNQNILGYIKESIITVMDTNMEENLYSLINELVNGNAVLFVGREKKALVMDVKGWANRSVEEPGTETVVRGPREGFIEDIQTNIALIRKKIRKPDLKMEKMIIGTQTQTNIVIAYLKGVVNEEIVFEVRRRLKNIDVDSVYDSGLLEEYIEDAPFSIFPTVGNTEKPDIIVSGLLEGKVAILVDGSPAVLYVPKLFINAFQKADDYYSRPYYVSLVRLIRVSAFLTATLLPAVTVALMNFHTELIPGPLLITIAEAREGVPFPLAVEVLFILLMYEWIREAGLRMPGTIGQAVNIIGAVILGETAVRAGLISAPIVIIIADAAITSFIFPFFYDTIAILRILFVLAGSVFGLYGVFLLGMVITTHMAALRSFGIPYTAPLFPITFKDWMDSIIRLPIWMLVSRPKLLRPANLIRQKWGGWTGGPRRKK